MKVKSKLLLSFTLFLSVFVLGACSKEESEDANKKVIQAVLELQFDGPDEEFMSLIHDPQYTTIIEGSEVNPELDKYVQEEYGPYFTQFYVEAFLNTTGLIYPVTAYVSEYNLNLKDVVIEKFKDVSNRYTFVATVGYQQEGEEEKIADVSGSVLFSTDEKGKIGKLEYEEDNGLLEELNKQ